MILDVTAFFKRTTKLHITTTRIRSMVETETDRGFNKGLITFEQKTAVANINGHTSQTCKDYYIRSERSRDAVNAEEAFHNIINSSDNIIGSNNTTTIITTNSNISNNDNINYYNNNHIIRKYDACSNEYSDVNSIGNISDSDISDNYKVNNIEDNLAGFGSAHLSDPDVRRAPWSDEEVAYIGKWFKKQGRSLEDSNNLMCECLTHLYNAPQV